MGATPTEFQTRRISWRALLASGVLAVVAVRLAAAAPVTPDLTSRKATQRAVSTAAVSSVTWTTSDFVAIGLMFLGATVVFIPTPKWRLRKSASAPCQASAASSVTSAVSMEAGVSSGSSDAGTGRRGSLPSALGSTEGLVNSGV